MEVEEDPKKRFYWVRGCMLTIVERMDEEFVKILKECDAHSNEYVERLRDEKRVCAIIDSLQLYIERQNISSELCRLYMRKIEHLYYKFDEVTVQENVRCTRFTFLIEHSYSFRIFRHSGYHPSTDQPGCDGSAVQVHLRERQRRTTAAPSYALPHLPLRTSQRLVPGS